MAAPTERGVYGRRGGFCIRPKTLCQQFLHGGSQLFILAGGEEILGKVLAGEGTLDQVARISMSFGSIIKTVFKSV